MYRWKLTAVQLLDRRNRAAAGVETEPLLGRPGDVVMEENHSIAHNLIQGTAPLAQAGGLMLLLVVWASVFTHKMIIFDGHPVCGPLGKVELKDGRTNVGG